MDENLQVLKAGIFGIQDHPMNTGTDSTNTFLNVFDISEVYFRYLLSGISNRTIPI